LPPHSKARKKVVDNENVDNHCRTIVRTYSGALAGTPVPARWNSCSGSLEFMFFDPIYKRTPVRFSGSKTILTA